MHFFRQFCAKLCIGQLLYYCARHDFLVRIQYFQGLKYNFSVQNFGLNPLF
nr:MAG TPA: hypothetical protein [Caudoviricetes sp.]